MPDNSSSGIVEFLIVCQIKVKVNEKAINRYQASYLEMDDSVLSSLGDSLETCTRQYSTTQQKTVIVLWLPVYLSKYLLSSCPSSSSPIDGGVQLAASLCLLSLSWEFYCILFFLVIDIITAKAQQYGIIPVIPCLNEA